MIDERLMILAPVYSMAEREASERGLGRSQWLYARTLDAIRGRQVRHYTVLARPGDYFPGSGSAMEMVTYLRAHGATPLDRP